MKDEIPSYPRSAQMFYQLLCIKAADKAYVTHTSDSLILSIVDYYTRHPSTGHLAEAYYYAGRVYQDLEDAPQALDYYHKAEEMANPEKDTKLCELITCQIGMIFLYQGSYDLALPVLERSLYYAMINQNVGNIILSLRDLGRTYSTLKDSTQAVRYYYKADSLAKATNHTAIRQMVTGELCGMLTKMHRFDEAKEFMNVLRTQTGDLIKWPRLSTMAYYYNKIGRTDSAKYYYSILKDADVLPQKSNAYYELGKIASDEHNYPEATRLYEKHLECKDSLQAFNYRETVRKINALYNYQLREKQISKQKQKIQLLYFYIITSICIIVLSSTVFILYNRYWMAKNKLKMEKLQAIERRNKLYSASCINKLKAQIKELESKQNDTDKSPEREWAILQKETLSLELNQIEKQKKINDDKITLLKSSSIYQEFHASDHNMSEEQWSLLQAMINQTYMGFTQRLLDIYPMSEIELKVCMLIKINLPIKQIPLIILRSKQTVSSIRRRLYYKVFKKDESPEAWDSFINSLI
ncbi:MAG: tetratricopeptide repeat protein [Bacteroides sp.]